MKNEFALLSLDPLAILFARDVSTQIHTLNPVVKHINVKSSD